MSLKVFNVEVVDFKSAGAVTALADGAVDSVMNFYRDTLGNNPTFEAFEAARMAWREGYAMQKGEGITAGGLDVAWKRFKDAAGLEKPRATTGAAVKQAAARVNPYADKPRAEVEAALEALKVAPETMETAKAKVKALDALDKLAKAEARAVEKTQAEALKPRRDTIRKAISEAPAHVLALVEAVIDLSADGASDQAKARAWGLIQAVAPKAATAAPAKVRKAA